jgi:hypothetical protein
MSFKTSMSGSLCLRVVRNVNVGLTVPLSHSKHLLWVRCILRRRWSCCTFVAFKTWGSLVFVLFIMQVLGFVLHTLALGSLRPRVIRRVSFGFFLPMLSTPSRCPICQVYALLMFLRWGRFWLLRRVESGGELAWVCRRQEICGSSINSLSGHIYISVHGSCLPWFINPQRHLPTTQKNRVLPWCRGWLGLVIETFG